MLTDIEQLLSPCLEDAALLSDKLSHDINRLLLGQDILLDPTTFAENIELYSQALEDLSMKHAEKGKTIAEIAGLVNELAVVVQENEGLIIQAVAKAEHQAEERERELYASTLQWVKETTPALERLAVQGNVDALFSLVP